MRHKNELLKALSKAQRAAEVEASIRDAFSINASLEVEAAKNFLVLFNRIDHAQREKNIVEAKLKEMMSLVENQQASIREGELQIAQCNETILDLKRKLAQAKADRKTALEQVADVENKIENERKMLRSVRESLANLGRENESLQDALNRSEQQLRELDSLKNDLFRLEQELETSRDAQVAADQEREKAARYAEEERETRRRCDLHLIESEEAAKRLREELGELEQRLAHATAQLKGLESDLAHERQWRREWDTCHAQVRLHRPRTRPRRALSPQPRGRLRGRAHQKRRRRRDCCVTHDGADQEHGPAPLCGGPARADPHAAISRTR